MTEPMGAGMPLAIYARVSTEEQREGQTIDSQVAELERFSREKGWPITGIYKDEGWSGGVMERPNLDRLRDDAQKGIFDAVLINDVDRLARDVAHLGVIKRDLEKKGVKVIFRKLPSDTSPTSNLMVNILGSFAEFERELIADRTRRGRRHKVEVRKQYLGSNTSYGFRYVPKDRAAGNDGYLEINHEEAAVVGKIFEWVDVEGLSARRVLRRLNEFKIRPKNGAASWAKSSVLRILRNEMYAGTWYYNKFQGCEPRNPAASPRYRKRTKCSVRQRPRNEWLPLLLPKSLQIVPRERWARVQQQLDRNITFSPRNEKHTYLLKGLVRCGSCGARYVGDPCHGRFYYRCLARCKRLPIIAENTLNEAVKETVSNLMMDPSVILESLRTLNAAEVKERAHQQLTAQQIEFQEQRLETEEQRVLDAYRTEIISAAQLAQQLEKLKTTRAALVAQQRELSTAKDLPWERIEEGVADYCAEAARNLATFTDDRWRELLRTTISEIIFHGDHATIHGQIPVSEHTNSKVIVDAPLVPRSTTVLQPTARH